MSRGPAAFRKIGIRKSLKTTLLFSFVFLALLPMIMLSLIIYRETTKALYAEVEERLIRETNMMNLSISTWFEYRKADVEKQASMRENVQFLKSLSTGFTRSNRSLQEYVRSFEWASTVHKASDDLHSYVRAYDYIYDVFLIDTAGNILFSVAREADLGTNLLAGGLKNSKFSKAVRKTLQEGRYTFSDLERYEPSFGNVAGFLIAPIIDAEGDRIGALAVQIYMTRINTIINSEYSGDASFYLYGEDHALRSVKEQDGALSRSGRHSYLLGRLQRDKAFYNILYEYPHPDRQNYLGLAENVEIENVQWILIGEIARSDALKAIELVGTITTIALIVAGGFALFLAVVVSRRIVRPLMVLVEANHQILNGESIQEVHIEQDNEIGLLAASFNKMVKARALYEEELEESNMKTKRAYNELAEQKFAMDQHAIISITDTEGTITYVNKNFIDTSGYSEEELLGENHRIVKSGIHSKEFFKEMYHTIQRGEVWTGQVCNRSKSGDLQWLDTTIVPFMPDGKQIESYIVIRTEVTDTIKAAIRLKESEELHRTLFDKSPDAYLLIKGDTFADCNDATLEMLRCSRDDVIGFSPAKFSPEFQPDGQLSAVKARDMIKTAFEKGIHRFEWVHSRIDGSPFWVDVSLSAMRQQGNDVLFTTWHDITIRKESLNELANQKRRLSDILEGTNVGTWEWNIQSGEVIFNERWAEIIGYTLDELQPASISTWMKFTHPDDLNRSESALQKHFSGETDFYEVESRMRHKNGNWIWVLDRGKVATWTDEGTPFLMSGTHKDITNQKESELELLQINRDLEDATYRANQLAVEAEMANTAKSEFLANMSHEIRTPMNGVIGMTNLLLDDNLTESQFKRAVTIKKSAESLLAIINDILDFSKIEAGKLELESLDFDIADLISDFAMTMVVKSENRDLEFICPASPVAHIWYQGDPGRIRQILINLVGNAFKFTQTGEVVVSFEVVEKQGELHTLRFEVKDSGIGLTDDQQMRLFNKFTQADSSTTRKYGGTGLGLAICKQLSELMGGEIGVISTYGEGAVFWFTIVLPLSEEQGPMPEVQDLGGERILVVDDNKTNCSLLSQMFAQWHIACTSVLSAQEGMRELLAARETNPYTIGIIDKHMPEIDGEEMARDIKNNPLLSDFKMVLLSSSGQRGDVKRLQKMGFAGYLIKPVQQRELYDALMQVVGLTPQSNRMVTRHTVRENARFKGRILIVEDNITNQEVAKGMLEKYGLVCDVAGNGKEAISMLELMQYDLVFMDCQMPEMDGFEATRLIRSGEKKVLNKDVHIIAMTANALEGDRENCLAVKMNDYVSKPVSPDAVQTVLEKWLPAHAKIVDYGPSTTIEPSQEEVAQPLIFNYNELLNRLMGNKDLVRKVLKTFLADMQQQFKKGKEVCGTENSEDIRAFAHKIKGAATNVAGVQMGAVAHELEEIAQGGDIEGAQKQMALLEDAFALLEQQLTEVIDETTDS